MKNFLSEIAGSGIKSQKGVTFSTSTMSTPFVVNLINKISDTSGKSVATIKADVQFQSEIALEKMKDGPDRFYADARKNVIESILFSMIKEIDHTEKFNVEEFKILFNYILVKNKNFLKIKDPMTGKRVKLNIMYTPMPSFVKQPDWVKNVDTASASPEGDIVFNINFINQLITYASYKEIKPKGSIYKSNGGLVSDNLAYIEFLILHEIYHIIHGDHFFQSKKEGMTPIVQNYLGDFISNANLVKAGYEQLPIGLYSSNYNYDNYTTMNDMQDDIIEDIESMTDVQKQNADDQMDHHMDDNHEKLDSTSDGQDGQDGQDGESRDDLLDDAMKKSSDDIVDAADEMTADEIENAIKKMKEEQQNESAADRRKSIDSRTKRAEERDKNIKDLNQNSDFKPINWLKLLRMMIPKKKVKEEESITKLSRRTRASLATASTNSKISIKAGIIKDEENEQNLMFVLDSSGSMSGIIEDISIDILKLIDKSKSTGVKNVYIIRFDSDYAMYKVIIDPRGRNHTYIELKRPMDILTKDGSRLDFIGTTKPLKNLFKLSWGGGTIFPKGVVLIIQKLLKMKFNQVLFTDSDILTEENIKMLNIASRTGTKRPYSFNVLLDKKDTYEQVSKALGGRYKYMSYISD